MMDDFIKVSNTVFNYNLSPKAIFVYIYLCVCADKFSSAIVKLATISKRCNMDIKTVSSAISELQESGFIRKVNRYNNRGYLANRYYLKNLIKGNKAWFKLPTEVFKTAIKATDFVVFCFINRCMSSHRNEAFPSLTAIHNGTGISRGRVSQAVTYLRQFTFVNRVKRHYKQTRAFRHSRYMKFKLAKRKACTKKAQAIPTSCSLHRNCAKVNRLIAKNQSLQFVNKRKSTTTDILSSG